MSMTYERAVEVLNMAVTFNGCGRCTSDELKEAVSAATIALREKLERENLTPLTIEHLRQMNGEPVWLEGFEWRVCYGTSTFRGSEYLETGMGCGIPLDGYGQYWNAYRHKPKEVQT